MKLRCKIERGQGLFQKSETMIQKLFMMMRLLCLMILLCHTSHYTENPGIKEGDTFVDKNDFVQTIKQYAIKNEFDTRLEQYAIKD